MLFTHGCDGDIISAVLDLISFLTRAENTSKSRCLTHMHWLCVCSFPFLYQSRWLSSANFFFYLNQLSFQGRYRQEKEVERKHFPLQWCVWFLYLLVITDHLAEKFGTNPNDGIILEKVDSYVKLYLKLYLHRVSWFPPFILWMH